MAPPLLTIADAGVNLGDRWLLRGADLSLHAGDRLALVGLNGAGKSTLMKLLSGQGEMDEGTLWMSPGAKIAYLPQAPQIPTGMSLRALVTNGTEDGEQQSTVEVVDGEVVPEEPVEVPTLSAFGKWLMALLLPLAALIGLRKRQTK